MLSQITTMFVMTDYKTSHTASISMYSLTFRVCVTTQHHRSMDEMERPRSK